MARGWESKSVESQQEEREHSRGQVDKVQRQRDSLELSRRRVLHELDTARSDVHRTALQNALHHLEDELKKLG